MTFYEIKDNVKYPAIKVENYPKVAFISVYNEPFKDFYDMNLSQEKLFDTQILLESLLDNFGYPDMIISSPFLIPRKTTELLFSLVKEKMNYNPNIYVDKNLSTRFKPNQTMEDSKYIDNNRFGIKKCSLEYDPILYYETYGATLDRVTEFCELIGVIEGCEKNYSDKIIYIITHDFIVALAYQFLWHNPLKKENFFSLNAFSIDYNNPECKCKKYCLLPDREPRKKNLNSKIKNFVNNNYPKNNYHYKNSYHKK